MKLSVHAQIVQSWGKESRPSEANYIDMVQPISREFVPSLPDTFLGNKFGVQPDLRACAVILQAFHISKNKCSSFSYWT